MPGSRQETFLSFCWIGFIILRGIFFVFLLNGVPHYSVREIVLPLLPLLLPFKTSHSSLNFSPRPRIPVGFFVGSVKTGSQPDGIFCFCMRNAVLEYEKCSLQKERNMSKDFSEIRRASGRNLLLLRRPVGNSVVWLSCSIHCNAYR